MLKPLFEATSSTLYGTSVKNVAGMKHDATGATLILTSCPYYIYVMKSDYRQTE